MNRRIRKNLFRVVGFAGTFFLVSFVANPDFRASLGIARPAAISPSLPSSEVDAAAMPGEQAKKATRRPATRRDQAVPGGNSAESSDLMKQTKAVADRKSASCVSSGCHVNAEPMHDAVRIPINLGCTDCHGGDATTTIKTIAHVQPKDPELWKANGTGNPIRSYARVLKESEEYIRFVNPGDLRAAGKSCGSSTCHAQEVYDVKKSMMTHGGMLYGAALYNNGAFPLKDAAYGESYSDGGLPERVQTVPPPSREETRLKGVLPYLDPLLRWEVSEPGNVLRVFERGGENKSDVGIPNPEEAPGRPDVKLSPRGFGTNLRTDPVFLGLQKTRLNDPLLSFFGTNDHPGDYRSSGCTACHVVYANDRDPVHSGSYARFGNLGMTVNPDPTIPKNQSGHPIRHRFTNSIPSSQCMVCHVHPGENMLATYFGFTWWDNETDGESMYPHEQPHLSPDRIDPMQRSNPEASSLRGLWGQSRQFLQNVWSDVNPKARHTQFADFHGHGWIFRAAFKMDHQGNYLDAYGNKIPWSLVTPQSLAQAVEETSPADKESIAGPPVPPPGQKSPPPPAPPPPGKPGVPVHLKDIHLEKGMHCVDCHFQQDAHGNGNLYGEPRAAIEIDCIDCHGTIGHQATLITSSFAAGQERYRGKRIDNAQGRDLSKLRTPFGTPLFRRGGDGSVWQYSMVNPGMKWRVIQTVDTITSGRRDYSIASRLAKTLRKNGTTWGDVPKDQTTLAHANSSMTCYTCHSSWQPTCFGCHLPMYANRRKPNLHNEGDPDVRNWTEYDFQVLRDDMYMLGIDGTVTGHRVAPVRSACAIVVGSQNVNRDYLYEQQQTISAEGLAGTGFSTSAPHTVRGRETKTCVDCHVSKSNDNNAWMSSLLLLGTNYMNFFGRNIYVAEGKSGFEAVAATEQSEPQAVIGSHLHKLAYPEEYAKHLARHRELEEADHHPGNDVLTLPGRNDNEILDLQLRGEYLYTANGRGGFRAYDVANIDDKDFSEKMNTAPVSPLGQRLYVKTRYAMAVASPSTLAVDPTRSHRPENEETPPSLVYAFLYVADKYEGLVVIGDPNLKHKAPGVATLLDGDPTNNFLKRALAFNPDGILDGANNITVAGDYAYMTADRGLVIVLIADPLHPKVVGVIGAPSIVHPRSVAIQFRYAFVTDSQGLKVVDVTNPGQAHPVSGAVVPLADAHNVYVARTYAYVAAGLQGVAIIDVEQPEHPHLQQMYSANGLINDARDVKIGMTNASTFAYVADGKNGLRVIQLMSPETTPGFYGFSPTPTPELIASYKTKGPALAISKGLDRDRAVDESGHQIAVFGRRGARPFDYQQMREMYIHPASGREYTVPSLPEDPSAAQKIIEENFPPPVGPPPVAPTKIPTPDFQRKKVVPVKDGG